MLNDTARKWIGLWLLAGCLMVFFQVIVGGVTRLTESGLSITEWKPVKGIVPPLNEAEWQAEFALYQQVTQFKTLNQTMTLQEFKWIYFWEYFHRFWARFMGFVFIIPFSFFLYKKWFTRDLMLKTIPLFVWGGVIGIYGWIMVSNGLKGMYVPPIHLSIHLVLALSLFAYLVWLTTYVFRSNAAFAVKESVYLKRVLSLIVGLLMVQLFLGGIVSGMKAGLAANTWPDINGEWIPAVMWTEQPNMAGFTAYNAQDYWGRILIQFLHRSTAYVLVALVLFFFVKAIGMSDDRVVKNSVRLLPVSVLLQAVIGIVTVMNCTGHIPVFYGVLHQAGAMVLIANSVFILFHLRSNPTTASV
ncbi:MAG: COX15/CtaA family protein [Bacteroidetes bacterium]|nr:COX15/CtaA family protein [Bacteroidota bacterium]MBK8658879.1 COX15/CtaA family protein [Bacteroidota bacterium]